MSSNAAFVPHPVLSFVNDNTTNVQHTAAELVTSPKPRHSIIHVYNAVCENTWTSVLNHFANFCCLLFLQMWLFVCSSPCHPCSWIPKQKSTVEACSSRECCQSCCVVGAPAVYLLSDNVSRYSTLAYQQGFDHRNIITWSLTQHTTCGVARA